MRATFGGHIPGAVHLDWRENFTPTTVLKDPGTLQALYASKGVTPDKEVIAHCQSGQRSCGVLLGPPAPRVSAGRELRRLVGGMGE